MILWGQIVQSEQTASQTDSSNTVGRRHARPAVAFLLLLLAGCSAGVAQDTAGSATESSFRSIQGDPGPPGEAESPFGNLILAPEAGSAVFEPPPFPEAGSAENGSGYFYLDESGSAIAGSVVYGAAKGIAVAPDLPGSTTAPVSACAMWVGS